MPINGLEPQTSVDQVDCCHNVMFKNIETCLKRLNNMDYQKVHLRTREKLKMQMRRQPRNYHVAMQPAVLNQRMAVKTIVP